MEKHLWWQKGIIYQVYPASFQDSNGDGCGDLRGIIQRLDYLKWLGIDAIWVSPVYPSPMVDLGYDVSDYMGIHPSFGTMADFERLVSECHAREIKLIIDFVPNHTSDQHPWFEEARSSRGSRHRDWYLWEDAAPGGGAPNNWLSTFGKGAWQWDEATGQYYYHAFYKEQPDLNWRNPEVQEAMLDVMRFWLDKGVDGFRVDVIWHLIKDDLLRDNPPNPDYREGMVPSKQLIEVYSADQPEVQEIVRMMRSVLDEYHDRLLIGEVYLSVSELMNYYGREQCLGVHLPYNFQLALLPWRATDLYVAINQYEGSLPEFAWPNWVLGNHDRTRVVSRLGFAQAKIAALLLLTLRGTPTIYYGEEIGMHDVEICEERIRDPIERNFPNQGFGRDPQRTPMQWNDQPQAGFSTVEPWLPVAGDYAEVNVEQQTTDKNSMLTIYRCLIGLRQQEPALRIGRFRPAGIEGQCFAFLREYGERRFLVAVNVANEPGRITVAPQLEVRGQVIFSTHPKTVGESIGREVRLGADEGIIARLE